MEKKIFSVALAPTGIHKIIEVKQGVSEPEFYLIERADEGPYFNVTKLGEICDVPGRCPISDVAVPLILAAMAELKAASVKDAKDDYKFKRLLGIYSDGD